MAPDRGFEQSSLEPNLDERSNETPGPQEWDVSRRQQRQFLAEHASEGQNFTLRGVLAGLFVGSIVCFSNMYFGLQVGWVSMMSMPSSLIGFAIFKTLSKQLEQKFTPVENVLVQTVAGAVGTMPLCAGLVAVVPALEHLLKPSENGPLHLPIWKLIIWSLGVCFFGVAFAVPLRKQVIIRENLKFPSGTATALMIEVLHGEKVSAKTHEEEQPLNASEDSQDYGEDSTELQRRGTGYSESQATAREEWKHRVKLLTSAFGASGLFTVTSYFIPILRDLPIFGSNLGSKWLWTLNPSPAYVGQGIIMGSATTLHMLIGAILGWGILSPLAKWRQWAPGDTSDWEHGSKGWIVWVSLAIMLADALVSLGWLVLRPLVTLGYPRVVSLFSAAKERDVQAARESLRFQASYTALGSGDSANVRPHSNKDLPEPDAPAEHLVSNKTVLVSLTASIILCILAIRIVFGAIVPFYATLVSVVLALLLSVMGVRALGETDLNPVSGISKLTQLVFALIIPQTNKNSIIINLIAGAVSEAGAQQAGDIMQDLKTGHLLGAAPKAQFWGQMIGSAFGAILAPLVYHLYTSVYPVPGDIFQIPTGFVWIFTARLVTGQGLPPMAREFAFGFAILFTLITAARIATAGTKLQNFIPGGIAVAVGMYNVPSFTLARVIGGLVDLYWKRYLSLEATPLIVLASGLILGEGVLSILNLALAAAGVKHL